MYVYLYFALSIKNVPENDEQVKKAIADLSLKNCSSSDSNHTLFLWAEDEENSYAAYNRHFQADVTWYGYEGRMSQEIQAVCVK